VAGISYVGNLPVLTAVMPEQPREKQRIVDPKLKRSGGGFYTTLGSALEEANPGDEILLRVNDRFEVGPIHAEKATFDVTIRADKDYAPILTLGKARYEDEAMFRLFDGHVRFQGLQFLLQPERGFKAQALVCLVGNGSCSFKDCVVTLDRGSLQDTSLAVVTLPGAGGQMPAEGPPRLEAPLVVLDNCLVRGTGELIWNRASRAFDLDLKNTMVGLSGSLLLLDAKENGPPSGQGTMTLTRSTAYLGGHLLHLRGTTLKNLATLKVRPADCLFLPASGPGSALIRVEGVEADTTRLKDKVLWEASRNNAYGGFKSLLSPPGPDEKPLTAEWKVFGGESMSKMGAMLAVPPPSEPASLPRLRPDQLTPTTDLSEFGVDLKQLGKALPPGATIQP
jgi:hypothetical protein